MDFFNESFFVGLAFIIFVALAAKPICKIIVSGLDKRSLKIREELDEAMRLKEEAHALLALYQQKQASAVEDGAKIIAHAEKEARQVTEEAARNLEEEILRRTEAALNKITQAEASVIQEIRENAIDLTISAARSIILENLTREAAEEIMGYAISDIERKFH